MVDDTGFAKDGTASPCVARQYSGTLGKIGNCQIGVSVHLVNERASCAADWRLFCPESWDDAKLGDPVAAARARRRRERSGIPDEVRHTEKWRLALEMIDEMTGPGGWGLREQVTAAGGARPVVVADAGDGEGADFRLELADRGWHSVIAVKGSVSARPADAVPQALAYGGMGRPSVPRYRTAPASLRQLAIAHADTIQQVTWRHGTKATSGNPTAAMTSHFIAIRSGPPAAASPAPPTAACPRAGCWPNGRPRPASPPITGCLTCQKTLPSPSSPGWPRSVGGSSTTPRAQDRPRPGPLRRPVIHRLAPARHPRCPRPNDVIHGQQISLPTRQYAVSGVLGGCAAGDLGFR